MRNVTKSILLAADHTNIAQAEDGDEALKILQAEKFDLIICDWDAQHERPGIINRDKEERES